MAIWNSLEVTGPISSPWSTKTETAPMTCIFRDRPPETAPVCLGIGTRKLARSVRKLEGCHGIDLLAIKANSFPASKKVLCLAAHLTRRGNSCALIGEIDQLIVLYCLSTRYDAEVSWENQICIALMCATVAPPDRQRHSNAVFSGVWFSQPTMN